MANIRGFGTDKTTGLFSNFFNSQLALLEKLYQYQFTELKHLDNTRLGTLYPLLFSIHHTGTSIGLLARHLHLKECYILARSFLESLITYTYILSCDEEEYSRYLAYTKQKTYRVLDHSFTVGDSKVRLRWTGAIELEKDPELKEALELFTSEKGKAKTRWTSHSLSEMLESIASRGGLEIGYLMFAMLGIYDYASEALHGTLYGTIFHIDTFVGRTPASKDELKKTWNEQFSALFLMLGSCIHTLIHAFHKVAVVKVMIEESTENLKTIGSIIKEIG